MTLLFLLMLWHSSTAQENAGKCTQENLDKCFQRFDFTDDVSKHPFSFAGTEIDKLCGEYNFFVGCVIEFEEDCPSKHGRRIMATRGAMHYVCDSKLYHGDREAWTDEYACVRKIDSKLESECSSAYHQGLQELDATNLGFDNLTPSNVELFHELCGVRLEYQRCTKALGRSECDEDMERILYEYTRVITQGDFDTSYCVDGQLDKSVTGGTIVKPNRIYGRTVPTTSDPKVKTNKETDEPKEKKVEATIQFANPVYSREAGQPVRGRVVLHPPGRRGSPTGRAARRGHTDYYSNQTP